MYYGMTPRVSLRETPRGAGTREWSHSEWDHIHMGPLYKQEQRNDGIIEACMGVKG